MTVMIGIDPHKSTHTAVAIDNNEVVLDEFTLRASTGQAHRLCDWADGFENRQWAIESANGLGYLLARQLVSAGETCGCLIKDVGVRCGVCVALERSGRLAL